MVYKKLKVSHKFYFQIINFVNYNNGNNKLFK